MSVPGEGYIDTRHVHYITSLRFITLFPHYQIEKKKFETGIVWYH